jgi:hypothetical protein
MNKLIYHTGKESKGSISPYDLAIIELVENKNIKITSPYISILYLEKMVKLATDWQLISDIDEWIKLNNKTDRKKIKDFIIQNKTKIHHCPDLHAKTIITDNAILLGSANFTKKGLTERNEVSVIIKEDAKINELATWFDIWWNETEEPNTEELNAIINELSTQKQNKETTKKLTSNTTIIKTKFALLPNQITEIDATIGGLGNKYKDGIESFEIRINRKYETSLPCENGKRININLKINSTIYLAGLRVTLKGKNILISPDLLNSDNEDVRLVDLMLKNGYRKNEKIILKYYHDKNLFAVKKGKSLLG